MAEYNEDSKIQEKKEDADPDMLSFIDKREYFKRIDELKKELFNL